MAPLVNSYLNRSTTGPTRSPLLMGVPQQSASQRSSSGWASALSSLFGLSSSSGSQPQRSILKNLVEFFIPASSVSAESSVAALPPTTLLAKNVQNLAYEITGAFEGRKPTALQIKDKGIISYGFHQATLSSGALGNILHRYTELSEGDISTFLKKDYLSRVDQKDATLKSSPFFLALLKDAGTDPLMIQAQHEVFEKDYWKPAMNKLNDYGFTSPLATSLFYDTQVHGGLLKLLPRTEKALAGTNPTEQQFLQEFVSQRKSFLETLAENNEKAGATAQAEMYRNIVDYRIGFYQDQLDANNLNLEGSFNILGNSIEGMPVSAE